MATLLTHDHIESIKRELGLLMRDVKSSHRVEAMARGLGFGSNAALRAKLREGPIPLSVTPSRFDAYLAAHGFAPSTDATLSAALQRAAIAVPGKKAIGRRKGAWRNMMVAAINAGLQQGLFGLGEDENHWQGGYGTTYRFTMGALPAIAYVNDISYGELAFHVAVNPTERGEEFVRTWNGGLFAGDAFAAGWLERKTGKWLQQSANPQVSMRRNMIAPLSEFEIKPQGYDDEGKFFL